MSLLISLSQKYWKKPVSLPSHSNLPTSMHLSLKRNFSLFPPHVNASGLKPIPLRHICVLGKMVKSCIFFQDGVMTDSWFNSTPFFDRFEGLLLGGFQTYFTFPQSCILIFIEVGSGSHVHICVVLVIRNNVLFLSRHVLLTACSIYIAALLLLLFWCCRYISEFQYRPQGSSWSGGKVEWRW